MTIGIDTLVVRPGALGDAILTLPALQTLRLNGASGILVLGTPGSWGFIRRAHEGLRIRDFSSSEWLGLFAADGKLGPAALAALQQIKTAIVYLNDAAGVAEALQRAGVATVITHSPPTLETTTPPHASAQLLQPIEELCPPPVVTAGQQLLPLEADPFLSLDEYERMAALQKAGLDAPPAGGFVALHPGSGGKKKCWPAARFAKVVVELACRRAITPLVFFGPADDEIRTQFDAQIPPGVDWQPVDNLPLRDVLALLSFCRGFIGNDSGLSHLAARACPVLALFGPTDPAIWQPLGKRVRVLRAPRGDLNALSAEDVIDLLDEFPPSA